MYSLHSLKTKKETKQLCLSKSPLNLFRVEGDEQRIPKDLLTTCLGRMLVPSGKLTFCYGKSPFSMGKSTIKWSFSIAMLVYQRVNEYSYMKHRGYMGIPQKDSQWISAH